MIAASTPTTVDAAFRDHWGRVLAALIGFLGDFELAEEAAQEAFAIAAERWPRDDVPDHPAAWLLTTARNRAINRIRRERVLSEKLRLPDVPEVRGLLALMLLHHARRDARFRNGELVLLADQDRGLWDAEGLAQGRAILGEALARGARGPYDDAERRLLERRLAELDA